DMLILNGTVVTPAGSEALDVAVDGETISAIGMAGTLGTAARKVFDSAGCLVIPGGIDPHVHYAMNFEGILTTEGPAYSFAAALGGNTRVSASASQAPPVGLIETIETRKAEFEGAMAVDWSLHAILTKAFSYDEV